MQLSLVAGNPAKFTITGEKIRLEVDCDNKAVISSMVINGQPVISADNGVYTSVRVNGVTHSSRELKNKPVCSETPEWVRVSGINYGDRSLTISETWTFSKKKGAISWSIQRTTSKPVRVEEAAFPVFTFNSIDTWEGAYQGYGGLAWFYLFNEKLCTYGVHTNESSFWNSKNGNGLSVSVAAPGQEIAMKYSRTADDKLAYTIAASEKEMAFAQDSGTNRRRFIRGSADVWAPFGLKAGSVTQTITLAYFDYQEKYGRGELQGLNGKQVGDILGTISRIGVIDANHFGGNSWHTPYGPICLHEQYIAQMGLGINDQQYLDGYKNTLDYYRDYAIQEDGRVYSRWAYTNEDAAPGAFNDKGFYEAQWGILMDANPDLVTNVAELYDLTGDVNWVKKHQLSCEKALDWILNRDSNHNGLVEMMTDSTAQKRGSDWIDIIWASWENAFVNAKLYIALTKWAEVELQLKNPAKAKVYKEFAEKLKTSFNRSTAQVGFWDAEKGCYVHWIDKDGSVHGRNMVTPVNFMAIAYGICDDRDRAKGILDRIETQMKQEKLFFWPLCMSSYTPAEGAYWQYPYPIYENGDLFLSWGSVAVDAYAAYDPEIAVKYVKNILEQYAKDGLAFQRYGRVKQNGLGDDILSGNGLTIVGLYKSIYGINPLHNRLYLNPHLTPELSGTLLKYNFRNEKLDIQLAPGKYSISNGKFEVSSTRDFGYFVSGDRCSYFDGNNSEPVLVLTSKDAIRFTIGKCSAEGIDLQFTNSKSDIYPLTAELEQLIPKTLYRILVNGQRFSELRTDSKGKLRFSKRITGAETWTVERVK